jgi:phosphatidylglycerophosphatase C
MNVYDFDKTIYDGDSSVHFFIYNLKKQPSLMRFFPRQLVALVKYKLNKISKTQMKTIVYTYFQAIPDIDQRVESFWKEHKKNLQSWYLQQRRDDDVIISASPTFLLKPICNELNVALIASEVDKKTGENLSENCYEHEKPIRFAKLYDINEMDTFYSDSRSDSPMADLAKKAVLVNRDKLINW